MKQEFSLLKKKGDVTQQLGHYQIPTSVSLNSTMYIKIFLEILQYWNLVLLLPS